MHAHTNRLIHETSPYLLQHAHNPVDWRPWGEEAFTLAKEQNKLVLVSIGYSSCHWCHVMAHESFEDEEVAREMNERLVCIKVDREERPDVDQVHMAAVQLITGRGGWPLNCFTLPDGRPVHGGTYFPRDRWLQVVRQLTDTWRDDPERVKHHAEQLTGHVQADSLVEPEPGTSQPGEAVLERMVEGFVRDFDTQWGGTGGAPKFPMPNNQEFLLRHARVNGDKAVAKQVRTTLGRMAHGGIFDQVGGGFARYSTDVRWKAPHFEKMLYDNAQLISLYSHAYQCFGEEEQRDVVMHTIAWAEREMRSPEGVWYSALDADSEGEEGRFYTWTTDELAVALRDDVGFATDYYNVGTDGRWENGRNILLRSMEDAAFARHHGLEPGELQETVLRVRTKLLEARALRVRPGLDDKALTSWNALMVTGLCQAYEAFGDLHHLELAETTMRLLLGPCRKEDGGLWHCWKAGRATVNGFLEDYCFTTEALVALYQATFDESWLGHAKDIAEHAIAHFHDPASGLFRFTSDQDPPLIVRRTEVGDNVMPSSNSSMARSLFALGQLLGDQRMTGIAHRQLAAVQDRMAEHPGAWSNWGLLLMDHVHPWHEMVIAGPQAMERRRELAARYIPGRLLLGSTGESSLPLLEGRTLHEDTLIYVCANKVCRLPVHTVEQALEQLG